MHKKRKKKNGSPVPGSRFRFLNIWKSVMPNVKGVHQQRYIFVLFFLYLTHAV